MSLQFHTIQTYAPVNATVMYFQLNKLRLSSAHIFCENVIGHYSSKCDIHLKSHYKTADQFKKLCDKVISLENYGITVDCDEKYESHD
jgi:hypothetical protein